MVEQKLISQQCASNSLTNSATGKLRETLKERLTYPEAIEAVGELLSRFPQGGPANPKGYLGGLAQILMSYPKGVALRCHDPVKGLARECEFLPTAARLIAWCERETEALRKPVDVEDREAMLARQCRERAAEEASWQAKRAARPTLQQMHEKHGVNWGIAQEQQDMAAKAASERHLAEANERALLAEYERAGLKPIRRSGLLISLTLARKLGHVFAKEAAE